jgi:hypothetical protein
MHYVLLFVLASLGSSVPTDEEEFVASAIRPSNGIEWGTMTIKVVAEDGSGIEGASVKPWALRAGNGHGVWNEELGSPREVVTNAAGECTVVYPKATHWGQRQSIPVSSVSMVIRHRACVARNCHLDVLPADNPHIPEITLKAGVQLVVAGVEPGTGKVLDHCYLLIENPDAGGREFQRLADGWLMSDSISEDRKWFRIVQAVPGQPPKFSQFAAWTADEPTSRQRALDVRAGTRVQGKIADNVPRPIERGHVVAWCGSAIRKDDGDQSRLRPIMWIDTAPIQRDGTFVFESLPTGFLAQFYAFANDSISAQPSDEAYKQCCKWFNLSEVRNAVFRYGQVLRLVGAKAEVSIDMELAGELKIKCVDPNQQPVRGVTVSSWPNQYIVGAGSTVFCNRHSSLNRLLDEATSDGWQRTSPFVAETGGDGIAVIRNLPAGKQSFIADNDLWGSNEVRAESVPGHPAELVIKLHRHE